MLTAMVLDGRIPKPQLIDSCGKSGCYDLAHANFWWNAKDEQVDRYRKLCAASFYNVTMMTMDQN